MLKTYSKSKKPKVSIIILTKNQKQFIERTLPMIFAQTFKDLEVIIVDSGSTDGALKIMEKYPVKILHYKGLTGKEFNHAKAFNFGARQAKGNYLIRLSGDAIPVNRDWLGSLIQGLEQNEVAGAFSKYLFSSFCDLLYQFWFREIFSFARGGEPTSFAGASCVVKRSAWNRYHFNEEWGPGEDWEWGEVMKRAGYKILYNKNSLVYHEHRTPILNQLKDVIHWLLLGWIGGWRKNKEITARAKKIKYA